MRNGLASFSDCAQPIVSLAKSILPMPRSDPLHIGPYCASTPSGFGVVSSSVPPAAVIAAGTPLVAAPRVVETGAAEASEPDEPEPVVLPVLQAPRRAAVATAAAATVDLRLAFMRIGSFASMRSG